MTIRYQWGQSLFDDYLLTDYWPMETSMVVGTDLVGDAHNGVVLNSLGIDVNTFIDARFHKGLPFNGASTTITTNGTNNFAQYDPLTISFWYNPQNSIPGSGVTEYFLYSAWSGYKLKYSFYITGYGSNDCNFVFARNKNGVGTNAVAYRRVIVPNIWYHLGATFDGSYLKLYFDGCLVDGPEAASGNGTTATTTSYCIGSIEASNCLHGVLDEIIIGSGGAGEVWSNEKMYSHYTQYSSATSSGITF